ncbi:MAG: 1-acyl-sn-glycerol-3-phosphate acyltransferase [Haliscomenobacteraceae bacterium CHB4]|nr:1-acyl-sn-glycerol-3-phosphate acyltransferase [Haliscomenobacteraceae bacterium CHB4]
MKTLRAIYRLLYFAVYTILKSSQIVFANLLFGKDMHRTLRIRRAWARRLLPHLGIRMHVQGTPPDFPCILAANHRSYLDPAVLAHDILGYGVAKAEVANWPVIGWGARVAGVIFLHRESHASRKIALSGIAEKIREGFPVIVFVEGTTHTHPATIGFKPGSFKLAAQEGFAVVPAAIECGSPEDYWVGSDTFLPHLLRRLAVKEKHIFVRYGPALRGDDWEDLMARTKSWIDAELRDIRKGL